MKTPRFLVLIELIDVEDGNKVVASTQAAYTALEDAFHGFKGAEEIAFEREPYDEESV